MKEIIFEEMKEGMEKAIQAVEKSFSKVRTGRASLSLLDGIKSRILRDVNTLKSSRISIHSRKQTHRHFSLGQFRTRGD